MAAMARGSSRDWFQASEIRDQVDRLLHRHRVVERRHLRRTVWTFIALALLDQGTGADDRLGEVRRLMQRPHRRQLRTDILLILRRLEGFTLHFVTGIALEFGERRPALRRITVGPLESPT